MRVLIVSDIHGLSDNLKILENKININDINKIVLLGDLFSSLYATSDDRKYITSFMNKYREKLIVLRGNCDSVDDILLVPVEVSDIKYIKLDDIDFYFTHGNKYRYLKNDSFTNGVLVYGHEHIPYIKKESDMIYVNVGSLSLPRNELGKSFAIYEDKKINIYSLDTLNIIDSISF